MKKLLSVLALAIAIVGCKPEPVLVSSITLNQTTGSIVEGETLKLTATVAPSEADNPELAWSSANIAVATVDATGLVTAVTVGSSKITAAATDGSGVKATCEITVVAREIPVTGIALSYTEYKLKKGETVELKAQVSPADATNQKVNFTSSNPEVATVSEAGLVTAVASGTAKIIAEATDGSGVKSAECVITVSEPKSIFLKFKHAIMKVGGKEMKQMAWYGSLADYAKREDMDNATWTSNDPSVVSCNAESGKFTAVAAGETIIKVSDADGNEASCPVKVLPATDKNYDYNYGVPVIDCSVLTNAWKTKGTFELGEGYVAGTQKITNNNLEGYKIVEVNFYDKPCDASAIKNPALYLRVFIDDITKITLDGDGEIELRSNMNSDYDETEEICWPWQYWCADATNAHPTNAKQHLKNGWNNIVLPFALSHQGQTTSDLGGFRAGKINYLRIFQNPGNVKTGAKIIFDQIRIVDWTEFDNCDNYDMWYDRMTDNNSFLCQFDENDKKEGMGSFAVVDHFISGPVSNYRLEMWPGREYSLPADMDQSNSAFKFWLYVSDGDAFKSMHCVFELSSELIHDAHNYSWVVVPGSYDFKTGWNEIKLDFSQSGGDTRPESKRDLRKFNYFRAVFTPQGAPAKEYTYKIDDMRIVKK